MTNETKHTPLPWVADNLKGPFARTARIWRTDPDQPGWNGPGQDIGDEFKNKGYALIAQHVSQADAAFIVRACNSHDALVEAAQTAWNWLIAADGVPEAVKEPLREALAAAKEGAK